MKIIIASDSFKGSLDAIQIGKIGAKVAQQVFSGCQVEQIPMADGGEGTVDCLLEAMHGQKVFCPVHDPLLRLKEAYYGRSGQTAIMEMAAASGLGLVEDTHRDLMHQNTYGTGELLLHALQNGCTKIYMGIGGSATNDGGIGFAAALGARFLDARGQELKALPVHFEDIAKVDLSTLNPLLKKAHIVVMSDVNNLLLGKQGASYIFGPQKGATPDLCKKLEQGMAHYLKVVEDALGCTVEDAPGFGAAGGLGAALCLFAKAELRSGVDTILELLQVREKIKQANLVVTGEGMMDHQSTLGKVPAGIGKLCKEENIPCFAVVGSMGEHAEEMLNFGIKSIVPTVNNIMSLPDALASAEELYESALKRALFLIKMGMEMPKTQGFIQQALQYKGRES